jgi:hypothetical protein
MSFSRTATFKTGASKSVPLPSHRSSHLGRSAHGILLAIFAAFAFVLPAYSLDAWVNAPVPDASTWRAIRAIAEQYVARESPSDVMPFKVNDAANARYRKNRVFAHYFPPYPLSFDNLPATRDVYSTSYLNPEGEDAKYYLEGGLVRTRPLPVGPWTSAYWVQINDAIEVLRAVRMGLDGFAYDIVDVHNGRWGAALTIMLDTAANVAPTFKIFAEPDCGILEQATSDEIEAVLAQVWSHPASFHLADGRLLVVPFAAENKSPDFWENLIQRMASRGNPIALIPVFLNPNVYAHAFAPFSYGESSWGDRDPAVPDVRERLENEHEIAANAVWTMPVAPQDERPNSSIFWEAKNSLLYRKEWTEAINNGSQYVQLITWNDFSESTVVEPSSATQFVFYDLGAYYSSWFKTGRMPKIIKDAIYYTHRRELFNPDRIPRLGDKPMKQLGSTPLSNDIEMLAFLTAPAILEIEINGEISRKSSGPGLVEFRVPASVGTPKFKIIRNEKIVAMTTSPWHIVEQEDVLDPIYAGGSSNRPFIYAP